MGSRAVLVGLVATGLGDLSQKIRNLPGLLDAYERRTGLRLHPGSLNVRLPREYRVPPGSARLEKEDYGGPVSAFLVPCRFWRVGEPDRAVAAFIVRTERSEEGLSVHPRTVVEVVAAARLREVFGLVDGDEVAVEVIEAR